MLIINKLRKLQDGKLITWNTPSLIVRFIERLIAENIGAILARDMNMFIPILDNEWTIALVKNNSELQQVFHIFNENFKDDMERKHLQKLYQLFPHLFFILRRNEKIVGYCIYKVVPTVLPILKLERKACLFSLAIDHSFRGQDLAKTLLAATLNYLKEQSISSVYLFVHSSNEIAIQLYLSFGFKMHKIMVDVSLPGDEVWLMQTG